MINQSINQSVIEVRRTPNNELSFVLRSFDKEHRRRRRSVDVRAVVVRCSVPSINGVVEVVSLPMRSVAGCDVCRGGALVDVCV